MQNLMSDSCSVTVISLKSDEISRLSRWGDWKCRTWTVQDLENDGPIRRAGKCRTRKMTDQFVGLENARTGKWRTKSQGWKMQDLEN